MEKYDSGGFIAERAKSEKRNVSVLKKEIVGDWLVENATKLSRRIDRERAMPGFCETIDRIGGGRRKGGARKTGRE